MLIMVVVARIKIMVVVARIKHALRVRNGNEAIQCIFFILLDRARHDIILGWYLFIGLNTCNK